MKVVSKNAPMVGAERPTDVTSTDCKEKVRESAIRKEDVVRTAADFLYVD